MQRIRLSLRQDRQRDATIILGLLEFCVRVGLLNLSLIRVYVQNVGCGNSLRKVSINQAIVEKMEADLICGLLVRKR